MEYVDVTPTWSAVIRIYLDVLQHGSGLDAQEKAREEITRLARQYDEACAYIAEMEKA
jgi:hypothetical protein